MDETGFRAEIISNPGYIGEHKNDIISFNNLELISKNKKKNFDQSLIR